MEIALLVMNQTILMFLLMSVGYVLRKMGLLSVQGVKELCNLLIYIVIPAVIIKAYFIEKSVQTTNDLLLSFVFAITALALSMSIAWIVFGKRFPVENFSTSFASAGFIGIPLVNAVLGLQAVFYITGMVACLNILQYTYGQSLLKGDFKSLTLRKILLNPIIIGLGIGLLVYFSGFKAPEIVKSVINSASALNAPIAMFVVGTYLTQVDFMTLIKSKITFITSFFRLLLIPIVTILVFSLIPGNPLIKLAVLLAASAPVGFNVVVFCQLNDVDCTPGVKDVCLSSILSILTMPLIVYLSTFFI
jgi:predicted permease